MLDIFDTESTIIFSIEDISVNTKISQHSRLMLRIRGPHSEGLQRVTDSIAVLMSSWPGAEGTIHVKKDIQVCTMRAIPTKHFIIDYGYHVISLSVFSLQRGCCFLVQDE